MLLLAFLLSGCKGLIEIPPQPTNVVVPPNAQATEVLQAGDVTEVVEQPRTSEHDWCFVRARHFQGLVPRLCADVARETRP